MEEIFNKLEDNGCKVVVGWKEKERKKTLSEAMKKLKESNDEKKIKLTKRLARYYGIFNNIGYITNPDFPFEEDKYGLNYVYCPFRGCEGDWVKLGVAKRHGAVLGDAICLNSSLPCVLVDVVRCKMGKFSCCVPGCTNNWSNSPEKKFHTLPSDAKVRRLYEKLVRLPDTFAPLQDSHRFNIATVQNSAGLGNSAPGISLSTS